MQRLHTRTELPLAMFFFLSSTHILSFRVSDFGDVISILFHVLRCNDSLEM